MPSRLFFATGNFWTVTLAGILVIVLIWPIITGKDADLHPYLLVRQAQASPIRQPGESAIFRANEIPYGYPLRKGLGVKDVGAPAWSPGRDGDLRDVWRKAAQGAVDDKGTPTGEMGKFMTVLGRKNIITKDMKDGTQAINAIGQFIQGRQGKTVAIVLPNSMELLITVFAAAFYGFKPVLIPYGLEQPQLEALLAKTAADVLIAEAATLELESALKTASSIKNIIWVVQEGSQHIDWTEKPAGVGKVDLYQWHDIVRERSSSSEVPASEKDSKTGPIATFWKTETGQYELIEYSAENIIAGVGGLLSTVLRDHKLTSKDILMPTASLTETYSLCWTLAALYSNASIALNSVAGDSVDLRLAAASVAPTVIIASTGTVTQLHERYAAIAPDLPEMVSNYFQKKNLAAGHITTKKTSGTEPYLLALKLLLVSQRDSDKTRVPSSSLAALRVSLRTRTAYALTSASVAGAVTQTSILDYRDKAFKVCVGAPVTSVEVFVTGDDELLDRGLPEGKVAARGPAVVGGKTQLGVSARVDADRTLVLL